MFLPGEVEARRAELKADLLAAERQWNEERAACGVVAVERAIRKATVAADRIASTIRATPATTAAGIVAKLRIAVAVLGEDEREDLETAGFDAALNDLSAMEA